MKMDSYTLYRKNIIYQLHYFNHTTTVQLIKSLWSLEHSVKGFGFFSFLDTGDRNKRVLSLHQVVLMHIKIDEQGQTVGSKDDV